MKKIICAILFGLVIWFIQDNWKCTVCNKYFSREVEEISKPECPYCHSGFYVIEVNI